MTVHKRERAEPFDYDNIPSVGITFLSSNPYGTQEDNADEATPVTEIESLDAPVHAATSPVAATHVAGMKPNMFTGLVEPASQTPELDDTFDKTESTENVGYAKRCLNMIKGLCCNFESTVFEYTKPIDVEVTRGTQQIHTIWNRFVHTLFGAPEGKIFDV